LDVVDRPSRAQSEMTVDGGHVVVEVGALRYARFRRDPDTGSRLREFSFGETFARVGVLNDLEAGVNFEPFLYEREITPGEGASNRFGTGNITPEVTLNLWGNDRNVGDPSPSKVGRSFFDKTGLALQPFLSIPTRTGVGGDSVEGGLIIPFGADLPLKLDLGGHVEFDFLRAERGSGYVAGFTNVVVLERKVVGPVSVFGEFWTQVTTERGVGWRGTADAGVRVLLGKNTVLDGSINLPVTRRSESPQVLAGVSMRF
jgi:hypothetical protein